MKLLNLLARWIGDRCRPILATGAFVSMVWGFHLAWEPLGYLAPGIIVFFALAWSHLTDRPVERSAELPPPEPEEVPDA